MHRKVPVRFGPGAARKRACTTGTSPAAYRCYYLPEAHGLAVQLVNASQAKNLPGRPKTGKHDAQWQARLTEMGLLRPSFVPPPEIRELRECTRTRLHLVQDRTRCYQRLEKLLEDAMVKLSSVTSLTTVSARAMIRALIRGERDPHVLAGLAQTRMKPGTRTWWPRSPASRSPAATPAPPPRCCG